MKSKNTTWPIERYHLQPQTGTAFTVQQDERIRVIDLEGEQVIELQARMDLIIGVTACSAGKCNIFRCTAVDIEVYASREHS
jgi:uncharacterized protein YcgI (DUF1989 family)